MSSRTLTIDGMHCEHCVDAVREALNDLDGITVKAVEIGTANISVDSATVDDAQIETALDDAGYELVS